MAAKNNDIIRSDREKKDPRIELYEKWRFSDASFISIYPLRSTSRRNAKFHV